MARGRKKEPVTVEEKEEYRVDAGAIEDKIEQQAQKAGTEIGKVLIEKFGSNLGGASVVYLVAGIAESAIKARATDVHFDPFESKVQVRYRIDGVLHDILDIPADKRGTVISRLKILADMDITETRRPQDGHISMNVGGQKYDIRVATLPTYLGEKMVLRLLDSASGVPDMADLGMEPDDLSIFESIISRPQGMTLVTGPTGSGKTTTLYAALQRVNRRTSNVITMEDPVEYQLSGINQVQVDPEIDLTFANSMRAALRQDPDTLLVGEIRDDETAAIGIRASMTGHRVFSTLHTNSAVEAINALYNMDVRPFLLGSALLAILAQRLVRQVCPECKEEYEPDKAMLGELGIGKSDVKLSRGVGCSECQYTGYFGRTAVYEMLLVSDKIKRMIFEQKTSDQIIDAARQEGMKSLFERGVHKVLNGVTSAEEVIRVLRF